MSTNPNVKAAVEILLCELEAIFDRAENDLENLREEMREDNEEELAALSRAKVDPREVVNHPLFQKFMVSHFENLMEHLTYQSDDE